MSLTNERFRQYIAFKNNSLPSADEKKDQTPPITKEEIPEKSQSPTKQTQKQKSSNTHFVKRTLYRMFTALKSFVCFSGIWLFPLFFFTGLPLKTARLLFLLLILFISIGNLNLFLIGKRSFSLLDAFNIFSLTRAMWDFKETSCKDPPLKKELILKNSGVYFGQKDGHDIGKKMSLDGHVIVFGGSGSGKSSCIAIPTLNRWDGAIFAIDIKDGGELEKKSQSLSPSHIFRPGDPCSLGYDPFWFVDKEKPENSLREIAYTLIPTNAKNPHDFWVMNEQRYLLSALYFCYDSGQSFLESMRTIYSLTTQQLLDKINQSTCQFAKNGMSDFVGMAPETLGGIVGGVGNAISSFVTDRDILEVLSKNELITPTLLENGERIFICIPEHKLDVYRELLELIISQFLRYFEALEDSKTFPVLFVLDEFARLGRFDRMINALATLRSKKVTILLFLQSLSQLDALYGTNHRKVMTDNCAYKVILNASDADSQQYFSKLAGTYERYKKSYTKGRQSSYSIQVSNEPIVRPQELATLQKALLISPFGLQWFKKMPYYL